MPAGLASDEELETALARCVAESLPAALARVEWLPAQLGLRRFARLHLRGDGPETLVARIDSPEDPAGRPAGSTPEPPLEPIRAHLERAGLPVPRRFGGEAARGIDLLEDLGDTSLCAARARADAGEARRLYEEACDLVPRIQRTAPGPAAERRLDSALFAYKAELFARHALPARGQAPGPAEERAVRDAFEHVARVAAAAPQRLAHRDYQSANLLVRAGAAPGARLVMIDLQGAFVAPPEYDLVCLLRDSYVELGDAELAHHLARVRPLLPDAPEPETFGERFDLLTLTRKGKDLARFLYAARERGDRRFLPHVPATVRALRAAAERAAGREPALAPLRDLILALPETTCGG